MYLNLLVGYLDRARKLVNWTVTRSAFPCFSATARHIASCAEHARDRVRELTYRRRLL